MAKTAPPLTPRQAARIEPLGLLADETAGLLAAWNTVDGFWAETVARAKRLREEQLNTRVDGEWSFIETLRHLINVTDAWIGDLVLEKPSPYTPVDGLDRLCGRFGGQFTVLGAFQNVIFEEWAHHYYATRDLALLA